MSLKLRIKFTKHGEIKYIGHLDVMRYFQKLMRRSETDIAYTGGFSPHQKMSFALALGVGVESDAEYMDIEVNSLKNCGDSLLELKRLLNLSSAAGMEIVDIGLLPEGSKNAMASVQAAAYEVGYSLKSQEFIRGFKLDKAIDSFNAAREIRVIKETKKKTTELNLREHVFKLKPLPEKDAVYMMISAGSVVNIKPAMVIRSLFELSGMQEKDFDEGLLKLKRLEIYDEEKKPLL